MSVFMQRTIRSLVVLGLASAGLNVWAGEFARAYQAALQNDAQYQIARFTLESGEQAEPMARAAVLPTVSATLSETRVQGSQDIEPPGSAATSNTLDYRAPSQSINARVPLYHPAGMAAHGVATEQVAAARSQFEVRRAELLERLTTSFLQRMLAEDVFNAIHAQTKAVVEQRNLMRRRLERGEGTRTEVAEARASLSTVTAQWAEARDQIINTHATLSMITGVSEATEAGGVARLVEEFKPAPLDPVELSLWIDKALQSSPALRAKRQLAQAAAANVRRAEAAHLPRLDLVASVASTRNESASSLNQTVNQRSVGVQLSIPIFSGGQTLAAAKQALAEQSRAEAEVLLEQRALELDVTRLFQLVQNGSAKLEAYMDALEAVNLAVEGAQRGQVSGLRTNAEVLEAMRKAAQAQRDLAQARYDHVLQRIRLLNRCGTPAEAIVEQVDAWLHPRQS